MIESIFVLPRHVISSILSSSFVTAIASSSSPSFENLNEKRNKNVGASLRDTNMAIVEVNGGPHGQNTTQWFPLWNTTFSSTQSFSQRSTIFMLWIANERTISQYLPKKPLLSPQGKYLILGLINWGFIGPGGNSVEILRHRFRLKVVLYKTQTSPVKL